VELRLPAGLVWRQLRHTAAAAPSQPQPAAAAEPQSAAAAEPEPAATA